MTTWNKCADGPIERPSLLGWFIFSVRFFICISVIVTLMIPLVVLRWLGLWRWGQIIVQIACKVCLAVIGLSVKIQGKRMRHAGAVVANHSSWLDILVLNACLRVFFVAKSDVKNWPAIGTMAKSVGTVFIKRERADAKRQHDLFLEHVNQGHKLLFFPEGSSTDGRHVIAFKPTLFQAFFAADIAPKMWVQPVSVLYYAPIAKRKDFYGWWGGMSLVPHMAQVLSCLWQGHVEVVFHTPLKVMDFEDRKALSQAAYDAVAGGMPFRVKN